MSTADNTENGSITSNETTANNEVETTAAETPEVTVESLQARIAELEETLAKEKARNATELYNTEKRIERIEREADNAKKFVLEKFASNLLDVVDNLERALGAAGEQENPVFEGVRLTHKALLAALEKQGISVVDPAGQAFNAEHHQAVGVDPNTPAGQVAVVLQKGYVLSGRLLRPAMVTVGQ